MSEHSQQESALRQSHFASGWDAGRHRLQEENAQLRGVLAEAGTILEALHASVQWELAPEIRAEIAATLPKIRAAIRHTEPSGGSD